jgi:AcrR family transcriptional regulator
MARIETKKNLSRKDVILKKAAALFRQKGFAASSMRELADLVGVEAPSLYNHIGSKNELLQAICFKVANAFNEHLQQVRQSHDRHAGKIEQVIRFHIRIMLNSFDEVYVANHEWKQLEDPLLSNFLHQRKAYENALASMIEEGIKAKEFRKLNPHLAVLTILSAVRGVEAWLRHRKNIKEEDLENNIIEQLLHGIIK